MERTHRLQVITTKVPRLLKVPPVPRTSVEHVRTVQVWAVILNILAQDTRALVQLGVLRLEVPEVEVEMTAMVTAVFLKAMVMK